MGVARGFTTNRPPARNVTKPRLLEESMRGQMTSRHLLPQP